MTHNEFCKKFVGKKARVSIERYVSVNFSTAKNTDDILLEVHDDFIVMENFRGGKSSFPLSLVSFIWK